MLHWLDDGEKRRPSRPTGLSASYSCPLSGGRFIDIWSRITLLMVSSIEGKAPIVDAGVQLNWSKVYAVVLAMHINQSIIGHETLSSTVWTPPWLLRRRCLW